MNCKTIHIRGLLADESIVEPGVSVASHTSYEYDVHSGGVPAFALAPTIPTARTLLTNYLYDENGNVVKIVDPKLRKTSVVFSSAYNYAWPTSVTNSLSHTVSTAYDFSTGLPTSFTDANNQVTTYERLDALDRLTSVTMPDGGLTEFKYCDADTPTSCDSGMEAHSYRKKVKQKLLRHQYDRHRRGLRWSRSPD